MRALEDALPSEVRAVVVIVAPHVATYGSNFSNKQATLDVLQSLVTELRQDIEAGLLAQRS